MTATTPTAAVAAGDINPQHQRILRVLCARAVERAAGERIGPGIGDDPTPSLLFCIDRERSGANGADATPHGDRFDLAAWGRHATPYDDLHDMPKHHGFAVTVTWHGFPVVLDHNVWARNRAVAGLIYAVDWSQEHDERHAVVGAHPFASPVEILVRLASFDDSRIVAASEVAEAVTVDLGATAAWETALALLS